MLTFVTDRRGTDVLLPCKVKAKRYKVRTPLDSLRLADPIYEGGQELRGTTAKKLYEQGKRVDRGVVVDGVLGRAYQASKELCKMILPTKIRSKTCCDIAITDAAAVLTKILMHKGYQANEAFAERCNTQGECKIHVATKVYWIENGKTVGIYVDYVRVKKVIATPSTRLRPEYFTEYLGYEPTRTNYVIRKSDIAKIRMTSLDGVVRTSLFVKKRTTKTLHLDKDNYRQRYAKPFVNYTYFINSDDIRNFRYAVEQVQIAQRIM